MTQSIAADLVFAVERAAERFLHGLRQVPDDRLDWKPTETAKTPLQIAARMSGHVRFVARAIADRTVPDRAQFYADPPTTRDEAEAAVLAAAGTLVYVLERLSPEDLEQPMQAPWGETLPVRRYLPMSLNSLSYFQGQLNYAQLAYGDADPNIPPRWRA